jgi:hypothetical protein
MQERADAETQQKDRRFYLRELVSEECHCGRPKRSRYSFCFNCFRRLPAQMQKDLYLAVGCGYEQAYDAAVKWLTE